MSTSQTQKEIGIDARKLTRVFGRGDNAFKALDGVSFGIEKGANIAILGKSGSGKSTLMHALAGLDRPSSGEVIIDGEDIWKLKKNKLNTFRNEKIGFVFQTFYMQPGESVLKNVTLPFEIAGLSRGERKAKAMKALKQLEIDDKADNRASDLSGGQKQRVCIARAVATEPEILFADEPTGNLDSTTGAKVEKILFDLNKSMGTTLIVVTHDEELAQRFGGRILIKDGKIQELQGKGFVK